MSEARTKRRYAASGARAAGQAPPAWGAGPPASERGRNPGPWLTSRQRTEDVVAGLEAGADDYVQKPFEQAELRARVAVGARTVALQQMLADRVSALEDALARVRQLQGLLPMCGWCRRIRNDENYWQQLESYVAAHSDARFTHGICPECREKVVQEYRARRLPETR